MVCGAGDAPLTCVVKYSADWLKTSSGVLLMYIFTGITSGLFGAAVPSVLVAAMETEPSHVPAAIPAGFTLTGSEPSEPREPAESQELPHDVVAVLTVYV